MSPAVRIGMLTPSSNTRLEPVTYRMLAATQGVTAHFSRLPVTRISLDPADSAQFDAGPMLAAAALLADAKVDAIMWNGTSGSWLGVDQDRRLAAAITAETGIPASTSTLALLEALGELGVRHLGLVTPYVGAVTAQITDRYAGEGVQVVSDEHLDITDNEAFGRVPTEDVGRLVRRAAAGGAQAIAIVCTNLDGASGADGWERELGVPVLDSIAVTLWQALRLAGSPARISGWGALLDGSARTHDLTPAADPATHQKGE